MVLVLVDPTQIYFFSLPISTADPTPPTLSSRRVARCPPSSRIEPKGVAAAGPSTRAAAGEWLPRHLPRSPCGTSPQSSSAVASHAPPPPILQRRRLPNNAAPPPPLHRCRRIPIHRCAAASPIISSSTAASTRVASRILKRCCLPHPQAPPTASVERWTEKATISSPRSPPPATWAGTASGPWIFFETLSVNGNIFSVELLQFGHGHTEGNRVPMQPKPQF
jgi:hypothetical protein